MSTPFNISWPGQTSVPMHTLKIGLSTITEANLDVGTCELVYRCAATDADLIPEQTMVSVWDGATRLFYGRALRGPCLSAGGEHLRTVRLVDVWHELRRSTYHRGDHSGDTLLNTDVPLYAKLSDVWDYLGEYFTEYLTSIATWPTYAATDLPEAYHKSVQGLNNVQLSSNIAAMMANFPFAGLRINHTTTPPTLVVKKRNAEVVTLDATANTFMSANLTPNDESHITAVAFRETYPWRAFFEPEVLPDATLDLLGSFVKSGQARAYPSGESKGGPGIACLFWPYYDVGPLPYKAEEYVYQLLAQKVWSGTVTLKGITSATVGTTINITNAHPDWETMAMPVQQVVNDFATNVQTLTLGVSQALDGASLIERIKEFLRWHRGWYGVLVPPSITALET